MSYEEDFERAAGWNAVDTNVNLNSTRARKFREYLKDHRVSTIIRYYAASERPKTLTSAETKLLSAEGFKILPVYQDVNRTPSDFGKERGLQSAKNALDFAKRVGQPEGSAILFAVDNDFEAQDIEDFIIPYFEAINRDLGSLFKIGAYGSGAVLRLLLSQGLIEIPWLSMSRNFGGTKDFFYSNKWFLRQVPPEKIHPGSNIGFDLNILARPLEEIAPFSIEEKGRSAAADPVVQDAVLGGRFAVLASVADTTQAYVSTEGVNVRQSPRGQIISELTIGEKVTDLGAAEAAGWRRVRWNNTEGVILSRYLRSPSHPNIEGTTRSGDFGVVALRQGQSPRRF